MDSGEKDSHDLYWIGPRLSDILGIEHLFAGAVVLFGAVDIPGFICRSLQEETGIRINHNDALLADEITEFYRTSSRVIAEQNLRATFLWYGGIADPHDEVLVGRSPFSNKADLARLLNSKTWTRQVFSRITSVLPTTVRDSGSCSYDELQRSFPMHNSFVLQADFGSGGFETFFVRKPGDETMALASVASSLLVSPLLEPVTSVNSHIVVGDNGVLVLLPSVQIHQELDGRYLYVGGDFALGEHLEEHSRALIAEHSLTVGRTMASLGYRGVAGIDFLLTPDKQLLFVEINPRFQGSTAALNVMLASSGLPSVHELHMMAFTHSLPLTLQVSGGYESSICRLVSGCKWTESLRDQSYRFTSPDPRKSDFNLAKLKLTVRTDAVERVSEFQRGAHSVRFFFDRPIAGWDSTGRVTLHPAVSRLAVRREAEIPIAPTSEVESWAHIKFGLLVYGARLSELARNALAQQGRTELTIRDGVAGGIEIVVFERLHINVPIKESFNFLSPFVIDAREDGSFFLTHEGRLVAPIRLLCLPPFVGLTTKSGKRFEDVGQVFTDRLSLAPYPSCRNRREYGTACKFCEIGHSGWRAPFTDEELSEVVSWCAVHPETGVQHVLVSGGSAPLDACGRYAEVIRLVRAITNMSIYAMLEPPAAPSALSELHSAGLSEIGMNIELFDRKLAGKLMPAKGKLTLQTYENAFRKAVALWGNSGAVRSILIPGLESPESTLQGVKFLCQLGVMPILSPFRPVPGTELEYALPCSPRLLFSLWQEAQEICEHHGLTLGPTCIACQNNTITLPLGDKYHRYKHLL